MSPVTRDGSDHGFGLVEIIVSFALLGILFASAAPLMVGALRLTSTSAMQATASELANTQLERARAAATSCADFKNFLAAPISPATTTDARGITYTVTQTAPSSITCPSAALLGYEVAVSTSTPGTQPKLRISTEFWTVD